MSTTMEDVLYDMCHSELTELHLAEEIATEAVRNFASTRVRAYFETNAELLAPTLRALAHAQTLHVVHDSASLLFSAIAVETGLREGLLRPVLYGSIHEEWLAKRLYSDMLERTPIDRVLKLLRPLLSELISQTAETDRIDAEKFLQRATELQKVRNGVAHTCTPVSRVQATEALGTAHFFVCHVLSGHLSKHSLCLRGGLIESTEGTNGDKPLDG